MMVRCAHAGADPGEIGPYFTQFVEGRRGEILDAALAVFAEKGYEAGTMREIASRIGVTEPALYRHYAGKEALFSDLVAEAGERIASRAAAQLREIRPERVRESLGVIFESRRRPRGEDRSRPIIVLLMMAAPHKGVLREAFRDHILRPMVRQISEMLPPIDAYYGVQRTEKEAADRVRAFISLFVGSFMTSMMFGDIGEETDAGTVDAMLAMMGWTTGE